MTAQDFAGVFQNVDTMISNLPAWQAICDVTTAAEASKRVYHIGTEEIAEETLAPCVILDIGSLSSEWDGSRLHSDLSMEVRVELAVPPENCETIKDQAAWVLSQFGAMFAGINSALNETGALMTQRRAIQLALKPGPIDQDSNHGRVEWMFSFQIPMVVI